MFGARILVLISTILGTVLPLAAQSFQGGIRGSVQDTAGGAVAVAKVTLIDEATNVPRATVTNPLGEFVFNALNPAKYTVIVEAPGFKKLDRMGVTVATQDFVTLDLKLEVGQVTESVNVTEETPLLETANASTGQVIDNQKLIELPNLGRNPFMLSKLSQNVVQTGNPKFNRMQDQSGSSQISIAGGPVRGNNYLLDGISITDSTNRAVIIPSLEAVQEVKIQANTYDAEVGRTGGGTFNTYLKSGSNRVHGSAFGYLRETEWLANNFFANRAGQARIDQPFRNYGGSIGGPVRIPRLYDGRNKTFFWVSGEAYRQTEAASTTLSVPTALERAGDFSQSKAPNGGQQLIYDPLSTRANGQRDVFAGNVIPQSRLNPIGVALASYYPLPNKTAAYYGALSFDASATQYNRADQTTWKLDQTITSWWRASVSYLHYGSREPANNWFNNIASPGQSLLFRKVDATQANTTLTPTATTVVALRYGFNRFPNLTAPYSLGFDLTKLGFSPSLISQLPAVAFPSITMGSDLASYGGGGVSQNVYHSKSFSGSVAKFQGRHSYKAGFDFRTLHHDGRPTVTPGDYTFNDVFTRATPTSVTAGTGSSLASLLLGYPSAGSVTTSTSLYNYVHYYGVFFHDDFRVSSKLTLNLGLRYEYETGIQDANNAFITGFDTKVQNPISKNVTGLNVPGVIRYAGVGGNGASSGNPNKDKFAPRIGVAYSLNSKTTLRGGYGIFWAPIPFSLYSPIGYSQTTSYVASFDANATPAGSLNNPFPGGVLLPVGNTGGELTGIGQAISVYDSNARSTWVQQYSFDVQRQLAGGIVIDAGYVGSKTRNLVQGTANININQLDPRYLSLGSSLNDKVANPFYNNGGAFALSGATVARAQLLLPFPQYTTVSLLNSDQNKALYHSLFVKAQKRFSEGLSLLTTYTWSQNMDASNAGAGNTFNSQSSGAQNNYDLGSEYGLSTSNTPHRWTTAVTYQLPFGRNQRFLSGSRLLDYAVGGWSINAIGTFQSGFPLAINQVNLNSVIGATNQRPNASGVSPATAGSLTDRLDHYISPAAFSQAPQFTFGNLSRTIGLRGPGTANWDLSLFKSFAITETIRAQFRAEALNFTNTPQFYGPNTTFGSTTFGAITSQANFPRLIQLGLRLQL